MTTILSPEKIAAQITTQMTAKTLLRWDLSFLRAIPGGAFIALGFMFFITSQVGAAEAMPWGMHRLIGGLAFSVGIVLVVVTGGELFTSSTMALSARAAGRITTLQLLGLWTRSYLGNLVGAVSVILLCYFGGIHHSAEGAWGDLVIKTAEYKVSHSPFEAFVLGIGCNLLVCIAVWTANAGKTVIDKLFLLMLPVAIFVATGFEHSVANMFMLPFGMLLGADITAGQLLLSNLLPVTLGNIVGGGVMIGLFYWFVFRGANTAAEPVVAEQLNRAEP